MRTTPSKNLSFDGSSSSAIMASHNRDSLVSLSSINSRNANANNNNQRPSRFMFGMFLFFMVVFQVTWSFKEERKLLGGGSGDDITLIQLPAGVGGGGGEEDDDYQQREDPTIAARALLQETQQERDEALQSTSQLKEQLDSMSSKLSGMDSSMKTTLSQLDAVKKERDQANQQIQDLQKQLQQALALQKEKFSQQQPPFPPPPSVDDNKKTEKKQDKKQPTPTKESAPPPASSSSISTPSTSATNSVELATTPISRVDSVYNPKENILDQVVRMLFATQDQANDYIKQFPGDSFRFYVYDLPEPYHYQTVEQCIHKKFLNASNCPWGSEVCTEVWANDVKYSKRRFNRNGDVAMSKILTEYKGPMRTTDPAQADLFIVPYPTAGNCECRERVERCHKNIKPEELKEFFTTHLTHWNKEDMRHKHLFLVSNIFTDMHWHMRDVRNIPLTTTIGPAVGCHWKTKNNDLSRKYCGQIVMPYTNLNAIYQPQQLVEKATKLLSSSPNTAGKVTKEDIIKERPNALAAFVSTKIDGNPWTRVSLLEQIQASNHTLAGLPVVTGKMRFLRTMGKEEGIQQAYLNSIFCPVLRGDYPPQKRLFDVMLSGCIPVVLEAPSEEEGYVSHFAKESFSIRLSYPFGTGIFPNDENKNNKNNKKATTTTRGLLGLDYNDLVVPVPENCHAKGCMMEILEDMILNHPEQIRQKQQNIARVVTLFSYGMNNGKNDDQNAAMKYPDAVAAMLVQARHYVHSLYNGSTKSERLASLQEFGKNSDDDKKKKKKKNTKKAAPKKKQ